MLHIHCGDYSAQALRKSGVPGEVIAWHDSPIIGATPAGLSAEEWLDVRAETVAAVAGNITPAGMRAHFAEQYAVLERAHEHDEVVLWFDACLFDQTILIYLLERLSPWYGEFPLSLICVGEFPGMAKFKGLGELSPAQMASLFPARHPVTPVEMAAARRSWAAFCADNPRELEIIAAENDPALPYLPTALLRWLQEYPSARNGLGCTEEASLHAISQGATSLPAIFTQVNAREERPFLGDSMLYYQLEMMAQERHPLLTIDGPGPLPRFDQPVDDISAWTLQLTGNGRAVLEGKADRIQLNGIDRWMGGVHLIGESNVWRWDDVGCVTQE